MVKSSLDYNQIRKAIAREIQKVTGLDNNHVVYLEAEAPNVPRPTNPYMGFKIISPGERFGDDSKQNIIDPVTGLPTNNWNSGGNRKMTISFNAYGTSHEEAYNYMSLWQAALDLENIQEDLRAFGIAVWVIGNVADLSALLNTGYEGRAQMDCSFGIAVNVQSNLGEIDSGAVEGTVNTNQNTQTFTVPT